MNAIEITRRTFSWMCVIVAGCIVCFTLWAVYSYHSGYNLAFRAAFENYRKSRSGDIDSDRFATRGVQFGMSQEQVDKLMRGVKVKSRPLTLSEAGHVLYRFIYDPEYKDPVTGDVLPLITEDFLVIFDAEGKAVQLERSLFIRRDFNRTGVTKWDLEEKGVVPVPPENTIR